MLLGIEWFHKLSPLHQSSVLTEVRKTYKDYARSVRDSWRSVPHMTSLPGTIIPFEGSAHIETLITKTWPPSV